MHGIFMVTVLSVYCLFWSLWVVFVVIYSILEFSIQNLILTLKVGKDMMLTKSQDFGMSNTDFFFLFDRWFAPFLFVIYFIITVFLVLNLVIAVILEKSELSDAQKKKIQKVTICDLCFL